MFLFREANQVKEIQKRMEGVADDKGTIERRRIGKQLRIGV